MSLAVVRDPERVQKEQEWRERRRGVIPSTLLPAIMGLPGAYGSPMAAYLHCKDMVEESEEEPEYMVWGKLLQRPILIRYAEKLGVPIDFVDEYDFFVDPECPYLGASLDGRWSHADQRPVDAKNIGFREAFNPRTGEGFGEDMTDEIPFRFIVQLTAQMMVTGTPVADLAVLFGGREHAVFRVARDEDIVAACREAATRFMREHVLADVPPPVDGSDEWTKYLASRAVKFADYIDTMDLAEKERLAIETDYARLKKVKNAAKHLKELDALYGNRLRAAIGEHSGLVLPNGKKIHFKRNEDGIDEDLEAELAELAGLANVDLAAFRRAHQKPKPGARPLLLPRT